MPISYKKLFDLMEQRGVKKNDLRKEGISPTIVARLVKNRDVNTSTIIRLCEILHCQPGDIMEYQDNEGFNRMIPTMKGAKKLEGTHNNSKESNQND